MLNQDHIDTMQREVLMSFVLQVNKCVPFGLFSLHYILWEFFSFMTCN